MYSHFVIENFRSYREAQTLRFGQFDGSEGSGITYIIGENNSGKTTLIEGLRMQAGMQMRGSEKNEGGEPSFKLFATDGALKRHVQLIRPASFLLKADPEIEQSETFEILPSRRHWHSNVSSGYTLEDVANHAVTHEIRNHAADNLFSSSLQKIEEDEVAYNAFLKEVRHVFPTFYSFATGYEDHRFIEYTTSDGKKHRSDFLGDGVVSVLRIIAHLSRQTDRPLVIDEPELSLHPQAQKRLLQLIGHYARQRQIIVCTHSPYFVSWEYIKAGATANKVTKDGDLWSEIHTLQSYDAYEKLLRASNWQQPFLMDVVAKEIFFHDDFLFVEGQEDVGLLHRDGALGTHINLFGYGVRGKDAFKFALQLASDLGVRKAGVILDNGESERRIKEQLEASFPKYKIIQWEKDDIRDKVPFTSAAKDGYFTSKGEKKSADQLADYDEKIAEINGYFARSD